MQSKYQQDGLTIIELMVVVAIAGILAAMAAPSFSDFINRTRQTSTISQLTGDLNRARSEAIKRNSRILVCVRATDVACGAGTDWQNGWLVCYDATQDGVCDNATAANPNPIIVHPRIHPALTLNGISPIRFNPSGTQGAAAVTTLTLGGTWPGAVNNVISIAATGHISRTP